MKIESFPETDFLHIELTDRPGADTRENEDGIELAIDQASKHLDLHTLHLHQLPFAIQ